MQRLRPGVQMYKRSQKKAYAVLFLVSALLSVIPASVISNPHFVSQKVSRADLMGIISRNHPSPKLVKAIIQVESKWDSEIVSPRGAVGLMQVMPSSARYHIGYSRYDLFCPVKNIEAGCKILKDYQRGTRNLRVALFRYSGGQHDYYQRVMRAMRRG